MSEIEPVQQPAASAPPPPSIPPGWFPDPNHPGMQRWWTGQGWSDHAVPATAPQAQPAQTVIVNGKKPVNHAFHLIMSLLTLGLWIPIWIIVALAAA